MKALAALPAARRRTRRLMLYAKYGRLGIEMLQSVFRDMGLRQDDASVRMVERDNRVAAGGTPRSEATLTEWRRNWPVRRRLVDTFLHGRERSYSVDDVSISSPRRTRFQGWLLNAPYYPHDWFTPGTPLYQTINALPETQALVGDGTAPRTRTRAIFSWRAVPTGRKIAYINRFFDGRLPRLRPADAHALRSRRR